MSYRSSLTAICRSASTIGKEACPGSNHATHKPRGQAAAEARQVQVTTELQSVLGGCTLPADLTPAIRSRRHGR